MASEPPIYLDYAATAPVDARVIDVMTRYLGTRGVFGNPASTGHSRGLEAAGAVAAARTMLAETVNAHPRELIWTSGATEADNLALKGAVQAADGDSAHVITVSTEHKA